MSRFYAGAGGQEEEEEETYRFVLVQNFFEELRQRVGS
jgi:hypothetical protein